MIVWGIRCRRCKGHLAVDYDEYGSYLNCLQCGHIEELVDLKTINHHSKTAAKGVKAKPPRAKAAAYST